MACQTARVDFEWGRIGDDIFPVYEINGRKYFAVEIIGLGVEAYRVVQAPESGIGKCLVKRIREEHVLEEVRAAMERDDAELAELFAY